MAREGRERGTISNIKLEERRGEEVVLDACSCSVDYLDKSGPKFGSVEWFRTWRRGVWMFGIDARDEFWPELGPFR